MWKRKRRERKEAKGGEGSEEIGEGGEEKEKGVGVLISNYRPQLTLEDVEMIALQLNLDAYFCSQQLM